MSMTDAAIVTHARPVQISKHSEHEVLVIDDFNAYDGSKHRRPADFNASLESLEDPDLEPIVNARERYVQWSTRGRPPAAAVPFELSSTSTSFDLDYGIILGAEFDDGTK